MKTYTVPEQYKRAGVSEDELIKILTPLDSILGDQENVVLTISRITSALLIDGPSDADYTSTQYNQTTMQMSQANFLKHFVLAIAKADFSSAEEEVNEFIRMFPITEKHPIVLELKNIIVDEIVRKNNSRVLELI